jgi:gas vesicle protein
MMDRGFAAFLAGLGVGVAIGMLFAPKTGGETRDIIKSKAGEGKDYIKHRSTELRSQAGELFEKGKEAMGRQKEHMGEAMEAGRQAYRETRDTIQQPPSPAPGTNI